MLQAMEMAPARSTSGDVDEATLLAGLRVGDESAYEQFVRVYCGRMLAVARRFLNNEEDARDAVQDAFLSAYKAIGRFDGNSRLATWLHRIVVNACLLKLRTARRRRELSIDDLLPKFLDDGHPVQPAAEWHEPLDAAVQHRETCMLVRQSIERLPETYRTVLFLRDIEQLDTEETARMLGVTSAVVKTRLHRARQALRTLLDPHFRGGAL